MAEAFKSLIHFLLSAPPPLVRGWRRVPRVGYYAAGGVCLWIWQKCDRELGGGVYDDFTTISKSLLFLNRKNNPSPAFTWLSRDSGSPELPELIRSNII